MTAMRPAPRRSANVCRLWFPQAKDRGAELPSQRKRISDRPTAAHRSYSLPSFGVREAAILCSMFIALHRRLLTPARKTAVIAAVRNAAGCRGRVPVIRVGDRGDGRVTISICFRTRWGSAWTRCRAIRRMLEFGAARSARSSGHELLSGTLGRLRTRAGAARSSRIIRSWARS